MLYPAFRWSFCALAALALFQHSTRAVVLDWDTLPTPWNNGDLSNTYQADISDPDSNVTISVDTTNSPGTTFYTGSGALSPTVNNGLQGGLGVAENSLIVALNLTDSSQSVTITISFAASGGANNVSFKLFDIDAGGGVQDQLTQIRGLSTDGVTLIAPTITTNANNTLVGLGINQSVVGINPTSDTGATSNRGNVTIDFGTNLITSLTFTFGSTAAFPDPAYQHFGLHDITFTPVPELNPAVISALSCLVAGGFAFRHRRKATPKRRSDIA